MALEFSKKQLEAMRLNFADGFRKTSGAKVRQKDGGYKTVGGGTTDYGFYSGRGPAYNPFLYGINTPSYADTQVSKDFKKIADEIGLKKVDSDSDLLAIRDYVEGYEYPEKKKEAAPPPVAEPEPEPVPEPEPEPEITEKEPDPEPEIKEEDVKPPTTPYQVGQEPVTIRNPAKRRLRGGIGQFSSGGSKVLSTIKSKLLNI